MQPMDINAPQVDKRSQGEPASTPTHLGDDDTPASQRALTRRSVLLGVGATAAIAGCLGDDDDGRLDLDAMEFEHQGETIPIESVSNAFVGEVTEELFIAVARSEGAGPYDEDSVVVYLCDDRDVGVWFTAEAPADGELSLGYPGARVEMTLADEETTGTAEVAGEDSESFSAVPATGDAGLYWAIQDDFAGGWIVLEDGRQRGSWDDGGNWW